MANILFVIKETLPQESRISRINFSYLSKSYSCCFRNKIFLNYAIISSIGLANFFIFVSLSPFILITLFKFPQSSFGYIFGLISFVFLTGNLISGKYFFSFNPKRVILAFALVESLSSVIILNIHHFSQVSSFLFLVPLVFISFVSAVFITIGVSQSLKSISQHVGQATAIIGSLQMLIAALSAQILRLFPLNNLIFVGSAYLLFSGIVIFLTIRL